MEEALRERRIKTAYLQAAEQNLRQLVSQPNYTLDSLNHTHTSFISRLHEWEQAQHLYERLISDDALENECLAAFNIRAKYTNFNMDIENYVLNNMFFLFSQHLRWILNKIYFYFPTIYVGY